MIGKNGIVFNEELYKDLRINCEKCFGFCCAALYFSVSEGLPANKDAGNPCLNLKPDFSCAIHKNLMQKGLKGCTAYDCFGAGQKVAQITYKGCSWKQAPELTKQMFEVFLIMRQFHEMQWYLVEAIRMQTNDIIKDKIVQLINHIESITMLNPDGLIKVDIDKCRDNVNFLLKQTSKFVRDKILKGQKSNLKYTKKIAGRLNLIGKDLRKINLKGADLRGAFLIAADLKGNDLSGANLIGADLRDADLRGANISDSIFITQSQINAAKGDSNTQLPISLVHPVYWDN